MSRNRIADRIRKNPDYEVVCGMIDDLKRRGVDISSRVELPTGKGAHPRVVVTCEGRTADFVVAGTPGKVSKAAVRNSFEKFLRANFIDA